VIRLALISSHLFRLYLRGDGQGSQEERGSQN